MIKQLIQSFSFTKMHGIGNDFIIVNNFEDSYFHDEIINQVPQLCHRRFGIGADGVILLCSSKVATFRMRIFNSDGSEPEMCGNGIRCIAKFAYDNKIVTDTEFSIETLAGIIIPSLIIENDNVVFVKVNMGQPVLKSTDIPVKGEYSDKVIRKEILINDQVFYYTAVSMGNPHAVIFLPDISTINVHALGPQFEYHEHFPEQVNVHFVEVHSSNEATMKIWERGSGATLACGTGACAVVVAGNLEGKLEAQVKLHLPGGDLNVEWDKEKNCVFMTGPATTVFSGQVLC